jgi:hypothetical protein
MIRVISYVRWAHIITFSGWAGGVFTRLSSFCSFPSSQILATKNEKALPLPKEKQSFSIYKTKLTECVFLAKEEGVGLF